MASPRAIPPPTTVEAKWGVSAADLTIGSGTLEEALEAAKTNASIKYIQLQMNPTVPNGGYTIYGGEFTLDLNGKTVSYGSCVFMLSSDDKHPNGATVTFTDTSTEKTGKIENSAGNNYAIYVANGRATITGGRIVDGICYYGGTLNLTNYPTTATEGAPTITDLCVVNMKEGANGMVGTDIFLPTGYSFYDASKGFVTELSYDGTYAIAKIPIEAKWGASADDLTIGKGTLKQALEVAKTNANIKYIQLQMNPTVPVEGYNIYGGVFTLDLNGYTVSCAGDVFKLDSDDDYPNGATVTFTDISASKTGKVECTDTGGSAISLTNGTLTIKNGSYKSERFAVSLAGGNATIEGGSFAGSTAVDVNSASLTIAGGSFTSDEEVIYVETNANVTVKGGAFQAGSVIRYYDNSGTLDLSAYPTTTTSTTTSITNLIVKQWADKEVTVGVEIKLPNGYSFCKEGDENKTIVTELKWAGKYAIIPTSYTPTPTTVEAKWGASAADLTIGSGTLEEALEAAKTNANIKYIQIQKNLENAENCYNIYGGEFTLDLNGYTVSRAGFVFNLASNGATVTFTDTSMNGTGKVECTDTGGLAISLTNGTLTIKNGSYKSKSFAVRLGGGNATIEGGSFAGSTAVDVNSASLTIAGGSFTSDSDGYVIYVGTNANVTVKGGAFQAGSVIGYNDKSGTLDLSAYPTTTTSTTTSITNLIVKQWDVEEVTVGANITLPEGYSFCKEDDENKTIVTKLKWQGEYAIIPTSEGTVPEAKWGASATDLTIGSGTLEEALEAARTNAEIKYIQLQKNPTVPNWGYAIYGGAFTLDLNGYTVSLAGDVFMLDRDDDHPNGATVTFTDTSANGTGKVECTDEGCSAIGLTNGTLTIKNGSYKSELFAVGLAGGNATIEGGSFAGSTAVNVNSASLTIAGGSFTSDEEVIYVGASANVTVKGGAFQAESVISYNDNSGTIDLSKYSTTTTSTTTSITNLIVKQWGEEDVTVGGNITLPEGYSFCKYNDENKTIVTKLKRVGEYAIIPTSEGNAPVIEAKWGASADDLTIGSGTLEEAFEDAKTNAEIKYIQLIESPTVPNNGYDIYAGDFTLDLNGQTISAAGNVIILSHADRYPAGATVTFTDTSTAKTGKIENSAGNNYAIYVTNGSATITGGRIEGEIWYSGGTLDLSYYPTTATEGAPAITDLCVVNVKDSADVMVGTDILLPAGYSFCDTSEAFVTELSYDETYSIAKIPIEAKWGKSATDLTIGEGTLKQALEAAKTNAEIKYIQLIESPTVPQYGYTIEGGAFTLDLNGKTISADNTTICVSHVQADVTITDSANGGTVESKGEYGNVLYVECGNLTIEKGTFIGSLRCGEDGRSRASMTIKGGKFAENAWWYVDYYAQVIDLSRYQGETPITTMRIYSGRDEITIVQNTIKLPEGYGLYDVNDESQTVVSDIEEGHTYGIIKLAENKPATITGARVKVGESTYTSGNITLTPTSGNVTITVTGTNLDQSDVAWVKYVGETGKKLASGWTFNSDGTTATITIPATDFASCTSAYQLTYSADGTTSINSGIYIHYVAETTSIQIIWGAMSFTYSDEQDANGADKGWTCAENANTVTVKNTGTSSVIVSVDYVKNTETAYITNVTGAFDVSSKRLEAKGEATFTLTITGKPDGALINATLGSATITIQKNEGQ